jgi:hypothetical protein
MTPPSGPVNVADYGVCSGLDKQAPDLDSRMGIPPAEEKRVTAQNQVYHCRKENTDSLRRYNIGVNWISINIAIFTTGYGRIVEVKIQV